MKIYYNENIKSYNTKTKTINRQKSSRCTRVPDLAQIKSPIFKILRNILKTLKAWLDQFIDLKLSKKNKI